MHSYVAFVQTESKLIDVAVQMLFAGVVIDTMQTALQDGPRESSI